MKTLLFLVLSFLSSNVFAYEKVVIIGGAVASVVADLNLADKVIAVDVTSTPIKAFEKKTNLGILTQINAEAILNMKPDLILYGESNTNEKLLSQLAIGKIKTIKINESNSLDNINQKIDQIAEIFNIKEQGTKIKAEVTKDLQELNKLLVNHDNSKKKMAFIYARGVNQVFLAGKETPADEVFKTLKVSNAFSSASGFKTISSESLIGANPDYLIMLESGVKSLDNNVWAIPGMAFTNAGKNKRLIEVETLPFLGFIPSTPKHLITLLNQINTKE